MEGNLGKIKVISDHFEVPTPSEDSPQINTPSASQPSTDSSLRYFYSEGKEGEKKKKIIETRIKKL